MTGTAGAVRSDYRFIDCHRWIEDQEHPDVAFEEHVAAGFLREQLQTERSRVKQFSPVEVLGIKRGLQDASDLKSLAHGKQRGLYYSVDNKRAGFMKFESCFRRPYSARRLHSTDHKIIKLNRCAGKRAAEHG